MVYFLACLCILSIQEQSNLFTIDRINIFHLVKVELPFHFLQRKVCILHNLNIHQVYEVGFHILTVSVGISYWRDNANPVVVTKRIFWYSQYLSDFLYRI